MLSAETTTLTFACPVCRKKLEDAGPGEFRCPSEGTAYPRVGGIWRFMPSERLAYFSRFVKEYEAIRLSEGRCSADPAYYRSLPSQDLTGCNSRNWRIRAKSFETLMDSCVRPAEERLGRPLKLLDLGAGNGWLSYHLAKRGHDAVAVDLMANDFDGLGAHVHFDASFTPVQAEFDHLPFADGQADMVIYNASFHYSTDYVGAIAEAMRVLRPGGQVIILDSPIYRDGRSGEQMVREREALFLKEHGFPSNAIPCENFLTHERLGQLSERLGLEWRVFKPFYGWGWTVRPWRARLRGCREPASFMVIVGERNGA